MTDFLEEIEEQLRSDRYKQILLKAWPWAVGAAVLALVIALAAWGVQSYRAQQAAKASEAYAKAFDEAQKGDLDHAFAEFGQAAKTSSRGYKALALMQQAGVRLQQDNLEAAVKLYDQAADVAPDQVLGDIARLKSAFALMDTAPLGALQERLKPLTDSKRPYHAAAREALAMAELRTGHLKEARSDFQVLTLTPDASQGARQRAQMAILAIDSGAAAAIPPAVSAARALPPAPPPSPSQIVPQSGADQ